MLDSSDSFFWLPGDSVRLEKIRGIMSCEEQEESQPKIGQGEVDKHVRQGAETVCGWTSINLHSHMTILL